MPIAEARRIRLSSGGERTVRIGVFPIGIETNEFARLARRSVRSPLVHNVLESLAGRAMMIGVDRLDYSKGLRAAHGCLRAVSRGLS